MFKPELKYKLFELWELRQKHSTQDLDERKLDEELDEFRIELLNGIRELDDGVDDEAADCIIMVLAHVCWTHKPKNFSEHLLRLASVEESIVSKVDRQIERWSEKG